MPNDPKDQDPDKETFKPFLRKQLWYYLIPNIIFNTSIPYLTLRNNNAVRLFEGEHCFARFILPMALLLPFIITFDMLKKTTALSEQGKAGFLVPEPFSKHKFMFKMAGINGSASLTVVLLVLLFVHLNVPDGYGFNGTMLSMMLGLLAAILTLFFTFWPIRKLKKNIGISY